MSKDKIHVSFYQKGSKNLLASTEIPINELPDTFEIETKMHISENEWRVIDAKPDSKVKFRETGKLELYLAEDKIETVNPKKVLYSLPTICATIGGVNNTDSMKNVLVISQDDWRQTEFISSKFFREINCELLYIHEIYDNAQSKSGFKRMHMRQMVAFPMEEISIFVDYLSQYFTIQKHYKGVGYNAGVGIIPNSFAFLTSCNTKIWGEYAENKEIISLNIIAKDSFTEKFTSQINKFMKENELYLVDWIRMLIIGQDRNSFTNFTT